LTVYDFWLFLIWLPFYPTWPTFGGWLTDNVSLHLSTFLFYISLEIVSFEYYAQGPGWLFKYVFLKISSSFIIGSFISAISVHRWVFGPIPLVKSLFSYIWSYLKNDGLISKSYLLEFMNSSVLSMLHLYLLIT